MKIRFQNVGIVRKIDVDLNSPLTIFTGPNGTGKTYLSYLLNQLPTSMGGAFFAMTHRDKDVRVSRLFPMKTLKEPRSLKGELDASLLYDIFSDALSRVSLGILRNANISFPDSVEDGFSIELLTSLDEWKSELEKASFSAGYSVKFVKHPNSNHYSFNVIYPDQEEDIAFLQALSLNSLFFGGCFSSMMFTAERTGISLFSKELALGRLKDSVRESNNRYPSAISAGLVFAEDRAYLMKGVSPLADIAKDIEDRIVGGKMVVSEEGEMRFEYGKSVIGLPLSSSTSKALGDFLFYLKYRAEAQSMVIVDEPEIHLHPDNQIILARIFAKMVNRGMRVVITTHSDYIIREFNNLIMLHTVGKDFQKEASELGYYSSDEYLNYQDIEAYLFYRKDDFVEVDSLSVSPDGFSVSTIDKVIGQLNEVSEKLYLKVIQSR